MPIKLWESNQQFHFLKFSQKPAVNQGPGNRCLSTKTRFFTLKVLQSRGEERRSSGVVIGPRLRLCWYNSARTDARARLLARTISPRPGSVHQNRLFKHHAQRLPQFHST